MSKFHVDLCLPQTEAKHLPEAIATAMAPFRVDQPGEWSEDWIWDWWHINSYEDTGDFAVRAEHDSDPRLIWEPTFPNGDLRERAPLRCAGGPRGLLDFETTRSEAVARAHVTWEAQQADFRRLLADHPPARRLTAFLARHEADPESYPRERAVAEHHAQPLVRALNHRSAWEHYPSLGVWVLGPNSDPITTFTRDPEPEVEQAARTGADGLGASAFTVVEGEPGWSCLAFQIHDALTGRPGFNCARADRETYLSGSGGCELDPRGTGGTDDVAIHRAPAQHRPDLRVTRPMRSLDITMMRLGSAGTEVSQHRAITDPTDGC